MFKPLATTICMAMLSSLLVSLTVAPALASMLTRRMGQQALEHGLIHLVSRIQLGLLRRAMAWRWVTITATILLMGLGVVAVRGGWDRSFCRRWMRGPSPSTWCACRRPASTGRRSRARRSRQHLLASVSRRDRDDRFQDGPGGDLRGPDGARADGPDDPVHAQAAMEGRGDQG